MSTHEDARRVHIHTRWSRVLAVAILTVFGMVATLGWKALDNNRAITSDPVAFGELNRHNEEMQRLSNERNVENDINSEVENDKHREPKKEAPAPTPPPQDDGKKIAERNKYAMESLTAKYGVAEGKPGRVRTIVLNYDGPQDNDLKSVVFQVTGGAGLDCLAPVTVNRGGGAEYSTSNPGGLTFIHTTEAVCQDATLQNDIRTNGLPVN